MKSSFTVDRFGSSAGPRSLRWTETLRSRTPGAGKMVATSGWNCWLEGSSTYFFVKQHLLLRTMEDNAPFVGDLIPEIDKTNIVSVPYFSESTYRVSLTFWHFSWHQLWAFWQGIWWLDAWEVFSYGLYSSFTKLLIGVFHSLFHICQHLSPTWCISGKHTRYQEQIRGNLSSDGREIGKIYESSFLFGV